MIKIDFRHHQQFLQCRTAISVIQCTAESVRMMRGVKLNHLNNHSIKVTSPLTDGMFPEDKSNPATIASIRQHKISRKVTAQSFLEVQQHTTAICWKTHQQSITTAKVVILAGAPIVCGNDANNWNNPFWRRERCKHFEGQDNAIQYIIQYVSPPKKSRLCVVSYVTISHNFGTTRSYWEPSIWACWSHNGESIYRELMWRKWV